MRIGGCGLKFFVNLVKADWETGPTSHLPCDPNPALLAAGESRDYPVTVPTGTDMVEWIDGGWVNVPMSPGDYLARIVVRGGLTIPPGVPVTITPAP
ncbi:MAG: hypothetical protein M5U31_08995 [Acidimicrobiia bacterium]|nr:hypothetical protein [Acidimicrobiia bacterium]